MKGLLSAVVPTWWVQHSDSAHCMDLQANLPLRADVRPDELVRQAVSRTFSCILDASRELPGSQIHGRETGTEDINWEFKEIFIRCRIHNTTHYKHSGFQVNYLESSMIVVLAKQRLSR
ncbi:hypothetical protein F5B21DRAFT_478769 [Xylaria acuta]|nr:hypothetical protein F5B21DRAFT_478769 [Xylaria acuta]